MDQAWLTNLDEGTAVVVPTRSLASILNEAIADCYIQQGRGVWKTPNIITWQDYCQQLWQANKQQISTSSESLAVISSQQALMLWTQVIEESRRNEGALTLLNVQQTARAVQRSWLNMYEWQISAKDVQQQKVADGQQFVAWCQRYQALLAKRGLLDEPLLLKALQASPLQQPFSATIFYAFDLVTDSQRRLIQHSQDSGYKVDHISLPRAQNQDRAYHRFAQSDQELLAALKQARQLLEKNPGQKINVVVPDLQQRLSSVSELASQVFYAGVPPVEIQQSPLAYRFSLGQSLNQWPAVETALLLINMLKGRIAVSKFSFVLRSQFLLRCKANRKASRIFDLWLQQQRISGFSIEQLPELYKQCQLDLVQSSRGDATPAEQMTQLADFFNELSSFTDALTQSFKVKKETSGYQALSFSEWLTLINDWLSIWGWSTATSRQDLTPSLNSVQYQLQQRWHSLLTEFVDLQAVQSSAGLSRVCEVLFQMTRDAVFLPKAAASPILISGIYEAIGRPVDVCLLIGMDDRMPKAPSLDPFIGNNLRQKKSYPSASAKAHFSQTKKVIESLLALADKVIISYAQGDADDDGVTRGPSPVFRKQQFSQQPKPSLAIADVNAVMESFEDIEGPAWQEPSKIRGGSAVFESQSNCAFKAFATYQLGFEQDREAEFGLDSLDRGNIVHTLLDRVWQKLQTQSELQLHLDQGTLANLVESVVDEVLRDPESSLQREKVILLQFERPRLVSLIVQWLMVDAKRPMGFAVVEREERRSAAVAGIPFYYTIDRLDIMDDGRTAIVDYKTGLDVKGDWLGERIRKPQLPLYAVALNNEKRQPTSGIAFARVRQRDCQFQELAEIDIFKPDNSRNQKTEEKWHTSSADWPSLFERLATEFLAGHAIVNPIDEGTCNYCELKPLCRVSQLRSQQQTGDANFLEIEGDHHD